MIHLVSLILFHLISFCLGIFAANCFVSFHLREKEREKG